VDGIVWTSARYECHDRLNESYIITKMNKSGTKNCQNEEATKKRKTHHLTFITKHKHKTDSKPKFTDRLQQRSEFSTIHHRKEGHIHPKGHLSRIIRGEKNGLKKN